ncbi:dTDP-4-dehydrorhamnose 3,5-epimerase [Pelosinus sp. sgz500959]|uniref:dTDP-4-dehydrorhamnose 3,5-epimerase n=1 Tax=Pelosinus sp. sgz500959 TaxID=3242472 RepID=UPI0036702185
MMIFKPTTLFDAYVIEPEFIQDERGFFARAWCKEEFLKHGLNANLVQCNLAYNKIAGTLRGMHYQKEPYQEAKLVSCLNGIIYDVIIDLRETSPTFKKWEAFELSSDNRRMLYVPEGFAHGYFTMSDHVTVFYQVSEFYHPECEQGVRWDDLAFGIKWPSNPTSISEKDKKYGDF